MNSVTLPWPDAVYLPNNLNKRFKTYKSRLVAAARHEAFYDTKSQMKRLNHDGKSKVPVTVEFTPPMRSGPIPDEDNMIGMIKHHRDGIQDAVGVNDRFWKLEKPIIHPRQGSGQVKITFGEMG